MESPATVVSVSAVGSGGGGGGGSAHGCPDSLDSSPRSRGGGDSWDELASSSVAAVTASSTGRLRLMCSYGGRIMPRPTDRSLCYLGGETRIVVIDRHATLAELTAKLSRNLLSGRSFTLKYQLPNEDLDSLISVATDEDLENMIDEYDRLLSASGGGSSGGASATGGGAGGSGGSTSSGRLRLFLFPAKNDSASPSAIGSLLDDSKTETWFVDALNSAMGNMGIDGLPRGHSTDSASINCLLGLEDDSSVHSRGGAAVSGGGGGRISEPEQLVIPRPDSSGQLGRHGQDVHSVPDSPMLDTTSSFGSASSVPSLSNLPPIRVRADDRLPDHRITGVDGHFVQMNISAAAVAAIAGAVTGQRLDEPIYPPQGNQQPAPTIHLSTATTAVSPTENASRVFSSHEEKLLAQPPRPVQIDTTIASSTILDSGSRPMYSNVIPDPKREVLVYDSVYRVQMPVATNSAGDQQQEQLLQQRQLHPRLHHQQQQQQYVPANAQYIHPTAAGTVLPVPPYYPIAAHTIPQSQQIHNPYDQQIPMYYLRQSPYPLAAVQQPGVGNPGSVPTAAKPAVPITRAPPKPELPTNLYSNAAGAPPPLALQPPLIHVGADQTHPYAAMGYHFVQQHHLSQSPATMQNYSYEYAADYAHPQVNFSQVIASSPALMGQYQTPSSSSPVAAEAMAQGDSKTTRAS